MIFLLEVDCTFCMQDKTMKGLCNSKAFSRVFPKN